MRARHLKYLLLTVIVLQELQLVQSDKCSFSQRYTSSCGLFNWDTCTRYRTAYRCCSGWQGSDCNQPIDTTPPVISSCPTSTIRVVRPIGHTTASATWTEPTATDNSGTTPTHTRSHAPGSSFSVGTTSVTYSFTDGSNNVATCTFQVTVWIDTTRPVVTCPEDISRTIGLNIGSIAVQFTEPTATDNSGQVSFVSRSHRPGQRFSVGTTTVTYTFRDTADNSASCSFSIVVVFEALTTNEASTTHGGIITTSEGTTTQLSTTTLTTDETSTSHGEIPMTSEGTTTLSATAALTTDETSTSHGEIPMTSEGTTTLSATADTEPPTIVCPTITDQFILTDELEVSVAWPDPKYQDNSGLKVVLNATHTSPSVFGIGVHEVIFNASDVYGNTASCVTTLTVTAACPATVNSTLLTWLQTPAHNQSVYSYERCDLDTENRGHGEADRVCMRNMERGAVWSEINYIGCGEQDDFDLSELSQTEVVQSNVGNVADALKESIKEQEDLTSEDIENIAEVLQRIVDVESSSPEITIAVVEAVSNLVTLTKDNSEEGGQGSDTDTTNINILRAIEDQVERSTANGQSFNTTTPNIAIISTAVNNTQSKPSGLGFVVLNNEEDDNEFREEDIQIYDGREKMQQRSAKTSILLPGTLFNDTSGVSFVVYNSDVLFPTNSTNQTVGSVVISAIVVGDADVTYQSDPVIIEFTVSVTDSKAQCVFWDFDALDWSPRGCELVEYSNDRVTCHCNHLTNFAVLVDISYKGTHAILEFVSRIGCGVSMVALLITMIIFIGFRRLRLGADKVPRLILTHLCAALFLLYLVFLVGIDQISNRYGCIIVASLLQYLTLVSLTWMAVEAFNMHLRIVRVFTSQPTKFMLKASCVAWGLPMLVTTVSLGAGFHHYDHLKYCFVGIGPALYFGMVLPIVLILLHNFAMFAMVMYRLCTVNIGGNVTEKTNAHKVLKRLQNAFAMSVLMGLTWVFGFFAIEDAKFTFSLIFCLCNSLQGLAVFILFCVRQNDVRHHLRPYGRKLCCKSIQSQAGSWTPNTGTVSDTSPAPKSPGTEMDLAFTFPRPTSTEKENVETVTDA